MIYTFETELIEGIIKKRNSTYTVSVELYGDVYSCYYPKKEKRKLKEVPCLLSVRHTLERRTPFSVEAIFEEGQWVCVQESTYHSVTKELVHESNIEINNQMDNAHFIQHIKECLSSNRILTFVDYYPYRKRREFNGNESYWVEEAIDQGMKFIQIQLQVTKTGIELVEMKDITNQYL
ncbi:MAG: hypothetical protein KBT48_04725 [Firmicutes bacterium]|nr:hypothetical protein [Bacillota bacterium]